MCNPFQCSSLQLPFLRFRSVFLETFVYLGVAWKIKTRPDYPLTEETSLDCFYFSKSFCFAVEMMFAASRHLAIEKLSNFSSFLTFVLNYPGTMRLSSIRETTVHETICSLARRLRDRASACLDPSSQLRVRVRDVQSPLHANLQRHAGSSGGWNAKRHVKIPQSYV